MEPLSNDLLTILVLVSISWAGVTFIAVIIISIIYIYKRCKKPSNPRIISPVQILSRSSSVTTDQHFTPIAPTPIKPSKYGKPSNKRDEPQYYPDTMSTIGEESYSSRTNDQSYPVNNSYRRKENRNDTFRSNIQGPTRPQYPTLFRSVNPATDIRVLNRHTPYPPDVIARDKRMEANRFPMEEKF
ncbi:unnamed protein product [Adineta ricciae]|uniref:Uncharacterized protein n=1 Tax=Adineta ricciae TaxID=249248 RepID=A0A814QFK5_ADIRI|nr:unnamed protein product [Adineta ricciae]CAF1203762.1 unnamed protein product [Adineta ricciae]